MEEFLVESRAHGWPSFRDQEVNWDLVRCLPDGETVSVDGELVVHWLDLVGWYIWMSRLVTVSNLFESNAWY
jgi:hypothetical protein